MIDSPPKEKPTGKVAYFNRELSWLAFNRRVLEQAQHENYPLLERLRFLCFVCSNLDEFYEIRVAGLVQQVESGVIEVSKDGLGPKEQLRRIIDITNQLVSDKYDCWNNQLLPAFKNEGVHFKTIEALDSDELEWVERYFDEQVYPVLTPLAIDPAHPFPQLNNKSLNILVQLHNSQKEQTYPTLAIIPVPRILPRVVQIETGTRNSYVFLNDMIKIHADRLFPGYEVVGAWAFRITRNSDLYIDEEEVENLLQKIEEELHKMRRGDAVRLEIEQNIPDSILNEILKAIDLLPEYVFRVNGPVNLMRLMGVYDLVNRDDLKFQHFKSWIPSELTTEGKCFDSISRRDYLMHHPFDSFLPVVEFIRTAAEDPQVFAIKQTLYRTSGDSPIIEALKQASRNGKQVTALVELKARFDELNNIQWARALEEEGVHVVYGLVGLKTHCKSCLIVRREEGGLKRYAHLGTGNYNPKTAKTYTDMSYFTSRQDLTQEVADLFNTLTGYARTPEFEKLLVAPFDLHTCTQDLIHREAEHARNGRSARIIIKVNSLIDHDTIDSLYVASQAGVQIDLIVRGICGLVPGVEGLSENIRVRSILGRFLEHSRIFYIENGGDPNVYLGSADWMQRNFFRRIESVFPIEEEHLRKELLEILDIYLKDNVQAKMLQPNGAYLPVSKGNDAERICAQDYLIEQAQKRADTFGPIEEKLTN